MNISILGCGRWGSFIAWYLNKTKHKVTTWGMAEDPYVVDFFKTRVNSYVTFPRSIELTTDLEYAVSKNETIIISISAQAVRELMGKVSKIDGYKNKNYVLCMKGIEESTGKRLSQVLIECGVPKKNIAVWVGPGHIQDFTKGIPGVMLIDSYNKKLSAYLIENFKSDLIKYYQGNDIIGSEIGAAAKNVMGIAAGMLDGLNEQSLKGALMARGTYEVSKLIKAAGGKSTSAYGLCHLGDYEATLFSPHSNNRKFGENFVQKVKFDKLAEGVKTSTALLTLAKKLKVEMPITKAVNDIVVGGKNYKKCFNALFDRPNMVEFDN